VPSLTALVLMAAQLPGKRETGSESLLSAGFRSVAEARRIYLFRTGAWVRHLPTKTTGLNHGMRAMGHLFRKGPPSKKAREQAGLSRTISRGGKRTAAGGSVITNPSWSMGQKPACMREAAALFDYRLHGISGRFCLSDHHCHARGLSLVSTLKGRRQLTKAGARTAARWGECLFPGK